MSDSHTKPINPFEAAIGRKRHDFVVGVGIHDVQAIRSDWSSQRAEAFLRQHGQALANAMLQACSQTIALLTEQTDTASVRPQNLKKDKGVSNGDAE